MEGLIAIVLLFGALFSGAAGLLDIEIARPIGRFKVLVAFGLALAFLVVVCF